MPRIYICYGQEVTNSVALQLYHRLADAFGQKNVFFEEKAVGSTFSEVVSEVNRYDFFLVVLEAGTLDNLDEKSLFYQQVQRALESKKKRRIIPLLVDGFVLPKQLPTHLKSLQPLTEIIGQRLSSSQFQQTSEQIIQFIGKSSNGLNVVDFLSKPWWEGLGCIVGSIIGVAALVVAIIALPRVFETLFPPVIPTNTPEITEVVAASTIAATNTPETAQITNTVPPTPVPPSNTPIPIATNIATAVLSSLQIALDDARNFTGTNEDWKALYPEGFVQTFNGVEMVLVPKGCFMMGSEDGDNDEKPVSKECFDAPFWIDKTEVTNAQYGSIGCEEWSSEPNQPRNCVTWFEAHDFCASRDARLPTEHEWEYAARGVSNWVYPWGDEFVGENVVYNANADGKTANVGSRAAGASWVGALDMAGNVWEWVSSLYVEYPYDTVNSENNINNTNTRVLRGGSFSNDSFNLRVANRIRFDPDDTYFFRGFRCVSSIN